MRLVLALLVAVLPLSVAAQPVAILPVKLLDTSHEARDQRADHDRRLALMAQVIGAELGDTVAITAADVASCQPQTTDCLLGLARDKGADQALFVVTQKTSTLILQIFANLVDVRTGAPIRSRTLNFRGDNDDSWRRAARFLARDISRD
ncbi:DUF2380 domain-containing protein [uncultured Paracoccus sp.]|uniref:DUF2380 domain-containing protein n=1 Tax=uncultured Paracoccus sp. TaxID=189685 RepID=UPI0025ECC4E3|nr:DUF2380 domain-containing protein [uncultured Paracoccus sp.]